MFTLYIVLYFHKTPPLSKLNDYVRFCSIAKYDFFHVFTLTFGNFFSCFGKKAAEKIAANCQTNSAQILWNGHYLSAGRLEFFFFFFWGGGGVVS